MRKASSGPEKTGHMVNQSLQPLIFGPLGHGNDLICVVRQDRDEPPFAALAFACDHHSCTVFHTDVFGGEPLDLAAPKITLAVLHPLQ